MLLETHTLNTLSHCIDFNLLIADVKQLLVKTIGSKPDVTPVCSNETQNPIMLIVCKFRTERSKEECRLLYRDNLVNECDSRFRLVTENQTVFLHLNSLKPEDGGNYTCQCSRSYGTSSLHLNVTVEADEDPSSNTNMPYLYVVIGVFAFIVTGVIVGVIHRKTHHGRRAEPLHDRPNTEPGITEPYMTYIQRENELYAASVHSYTSANNSNMFP
ncbi:uncharacterized protein LOC119015603 [Acanthopagrus latus]|uniref:uncharacterized protein LOC119015603 n=1 Tax=Acanthopagrus latus TaxID=8177 RepID=UPI00187CEB68|nr:uncharacterized protein LOC119015603 [Acanthopagrus latus]